MNDIKDVLLKDLEERTKNGVPRKYHNTPQYIIDKIPLERVSDERKTFLKEQIPYMQKVIATYYYIEATTNNRDVKFLAKWEAEYVNIMLHRYLNL